LFFFSDDRDELKLERELGVRWYTNLRYAYERYAYARGLVSGIEV
jgi:hypothetical protein